MFKGSNLSKFEQKQFPDRNSPSHYTYAEVVNNFHKIGIPVKKHARTKTIRSDRNERIIVDTVNENPHVSLRRQFQRESGISKTGIIWTLQEERFHPYHLSLHFTGSSWNKFRK